MKKRDRQAEKKIIDFLLDYTGKKHYLSIIAKGSGVSTSTCHQILEKKTKAGLVKKEKYGNLSLYTFDLDDPLVRQLKITRTVEILKKLVKELKKESQKIILFGSASLGRNTYQSDLDLFILTNEKQEVRRIIKKFKTKSKIQPVIKNILEFGKLKRKDKFFYEEINRGTVLWEAKSGRSI